MTGSVRISQDRSAGGGCWDRRPPRIPRGNEAITVWINIYRPALRLGRFGVDGGLDLLLAEGDLGGVHLVLQRLDLRLGLRLLRGDELEALRDVAVGLELLLGHEHGADQLVDLRLVVEAVELLLHNARLLELHLELLQLHHRLVQLALVCLQLLRDRLHGGG